MATASTAFLRRAVLARARRFAAAGSVGRASGAVAPGSLDDLVACSRGSTMVSFSSQCCSACRSVRGTLQLKERILEHPAADGLIQVNAAVLISNSMVAGGEGTDC
ncbi:MAG TPA: hypothetical protein PL117_18630, partial [Accumulibacter sp.]|nr:hypothetical protein [Accumulibacter sp.]